MLSATESRLPCRWPWAVCLRDRAELPVAHFLTAVVELAKALNVELVVTMGALLADVPHSRPVSVSANSQDAALVESLGLSASLRGRRASPAYCTARAPTAVCPR